MKLELVALGIGPGIVALAQAPMVPPEVDGWLKVGGIVVSITATILTAKHLAEQAKHRADDAYNAAMATDQRASVIGSKLDVLRVALHDESDRVTKLATEQQRDQQEITRLRDARHDYIDKDLNPRLMRFENNVEDEIEKFGARMAVIESLVRGGRDA